MHGALECILLVPIEDILLFHVGGVYRGVRCDERSAVKERGGDDRAGPPRAAKWFLPEKTPDPFSCFM